MRIAGWIYVEEIWTIAIRKSNNVFGIISVTGLGI